MSRADQFESIFRAASREPFQHRDLDINSILVVTDLDRSEADAFTQRLRSFLSVLTKNEAPSWKTLTRDDFSSVQSLLDIVESESPDLICAYRNLGTKAWEFRHTLGDHLEVLTQTTKTPVLVLPHPRAGLEAGHALHDTDCVMAITDHLAGDDRLVSCAANFTAPGGSLYLTHVEDQTLFARYVDAISKIPEIDTDLARERIMERLLKDPRDFIQSCREELARHNLDIEVHDIVAPGHRIREYEALIENHEIDLLVFHTKDDDQLAMHGLAYPLAVELRHIPLLMI